MSRRSGDPARFFRHSAPTAWGLMKGIPRPTPRSSLTVAFTPECNSPSQDGFHAALYPEQNGEGRRGGEG